MAIRNPVAFAFDRAGYDAYIAERQGTFEKELARQQAGGGPTPEP